MKESSRIAVIILGAPGSGKGTQAALLAKKLGLFHFDTGRVLEKIVYDRRLVKNKKVWKMRRFFESGALLPSSWVLAILKKEIRKISGAGLGIVLSGSPRTFSEAFGGGKEEGLFNFLKKFYGLKNIFIVFLKVDAAAAVKRNSNRFICSVCETPLISQKLELKIGGLKRKCPFCGGALRKRVFDTVSGMKVRLREYRRLSLPIIKELKKRRFSLIEVSGDKTPYFVAEKIFRKIVN